MAEPQTEREIFRENAKNFFTWLTKSADEQAKDALPPKLPPKEAQKQADRGDKAA